MGEYRLPEKARIGLTWRRIKNVFRSPLLLIRNARFWWNEDISQDRHIFVMGPPRSGTTLVKNVLQSHTDICGVDGETWFFLRRNYAGFRHRSLQDEEMEQMIRASRSPVELFDRLAREVCGRHQASRFLEKTPEHALRLDYILNHFPKAHVVFVIRDPRDGLRSAKDYQRYWSSLPEKDRTGGYIETWRRSVNAYLEHAEHSAVLLVRYEEFCQNPRKQLQELTDFLGIRFQERQLCSTSYGQTYLSDSGGHDRLKEQITSKSVGKWRQKLNESEINRIEDKLSAEMNTLGYRLSSMQ